MGEVGIPALQARPSRGAGHGTAGDATPQEAQAPFALQQVVIAHPHPPRQHLEAHEAGPMARLVDLALDRMQPQAQGRQLGIQQLASLAQR